MADDTATTSIFEEDEKVALPSHVNTDHSADDDLAVVSSLKSLLELSEGHSESLSDITKVVIDTIPGYSAAAVHKCLVTAFPDLQAQQSSSKEEIYYLGIKFSSSVQSEEDVVAWLRQRFKEDQFGSISCRTLFDIATREIGYTKQNTIGNFVRKAFPFVYTRRSDRFRWYCGIIQPEIEVTIEEKNRKLWLENACRWLRLNMREKTDKNFVVKEKCSMVYSGLMQYVGKVSIDSCLAAVKCVFPNVIRKTFDRNAFYIGIQFMHDSVRSSIRCTPSKHRGHSIPKIISDDEKETVIWLQSVLERKEDHRLKLVDLTNILNRRTGHVLNDKSALQLVRKAFPEIIYRKRDGLASVKGVDIKDQFKPKDLWLDKATTWVKKILVARPTDHCEKFSSISGILKDGLQQISYSKIYDILKIAFPHIILKNLGDRKIVFGVSLAEDHLRIPNPTFSDEDTVADFSHIDMDQEIIFNKSHLSTSHEESASFTNGHDIHILEGKINSLLSVVDELRTDMKGLKDELAQSSRQKDNLIIQLQQTLVLLTQQQFQRMVKPSESCMNGNDTNLLNLTGLNSLRNNVHNTKDLEENDQ